MVTMLGPITPEESTEWAAELAALRAYRDDVRRIRSEPGHVTKAELDGVEQTYQERMRA